MSNVFFTARKTIKEFATGGNVLIIATILAMLIANISAINHYYFDFWNQKVAFQLGDFNLFSHEGHPMTMMQFINDALMAVFFFTIGLEIKREVLVGELSSFRQALLPIIAACGGMIVPVAIFFYLGRNGDYENGAAIPMATDIAFSIGVLAMLGSRVPTSLKIFLTTLAVVDDIGGILVIALFYSQGLEYTLLLYSLGIFAILIAGSMLKIKSKAFYILLGIAVWFLFLNSGIHPTIAGVLVAFCIPATPVASPKKYISTIKDSMAHLCDNEDIDLEKRTILSNEKMDWLKRIESASNKTISPLQQLEDALHPVVNFFIIPLFAFANAGILLEGMEPSALYEGVGLAVICGLVIGKFTGIFLFSWALIKLGFSSMPAYSNWKMLASVSMLGGIGFTVSLFIANLSFGPTGTNHPEYLTDAKLGIIVGSLIAGFVGYFMLKMTLPKEKFHEENDID